MRTIEPWRLEVQRCALGVAWALFAPDGGFVKAKPIESAMRMVPVGAKLAVWLDGRFEQEVTIVR